MELSAPASKVQVAAVVCAAGSSARMGGQKKEYRLAPENSGEGLTVLGAVVRAFAKVPAVEIIAIAIPPNDEESASRALPSQYLASSKPKIIFVEGGQTRQASVYNALCALERFNPCYVLIHDGARPWVSPLLIEKTIEAAQKYGAAIPLLEFTDTPKECDGIFIARHLRRANTGAAQTPQGFKFPEILRAHEKAALVDEDFTDDAEVWGKFRGQVAVIPGEAENRKITFQGDL